MIDFDVQHHFSEGVYARQMVIAKDVVVPTHKHKFSHMSILASGRVLVTVDGVSVEYAAPTAIEIKKNEVHTIQALEDSVWFCVHATDVVDPEEIDHELIVGK